MKEQCDLPHIKHIDRVHAINVFRQHGCICIKWKHYLTSDSWSRPIVIAPPHLMPDVAAWRPQHVVQAFQPATVTAHVSWLHKFEMMMADSGSGDHTADLERLRRIVLQTDDQYANKVNIDTILTDLQKIGGVSSSTTAGSRLQLFPDDALVQLFLGADHPPMPPDLLVHIDDRWAPKEDAPICPSSIVICSSLGASAYKVALPFTMGIVAAPLDPSTDGDIILQWLVPPLGPESAARGRQRQTVDMFGTWRAYTSLPLADAGHYEMPDVQVSKGSVLIGPTELADGKLSFDTLDALVDLHGIDITGLRWTRTRCGNAYRSYKLLNF